MSMSLLKGRGAAKSSNSMSFMSIRSKRSSGSINNLDAMRQKHKSNVYPKGFIYQPKVSENFLESWLDFPTNPTNVIGNIFYLPYIWLLHTNKAMAGLDPSTPSVRERLCNQSSVLGTAAGLYLVIAVAGFLAPPKANSPDDQILVDVFGAMMFTSSICLGMYIALSLTNYYPLVQSLRDDVAFDAFEVYLNRWGGYELYLFNIGFQLIFFALLVSCRVLYSHTLVYVLLGVFFLVYMAVVFISKEMFLSFDPITSMHLGLSSDPNDMYRAEMMAHYLLKKIPNNIITEEGGEAAVDVFRDAAPHKPAGDPERLAAEKLEKINIKRKEAPKRNQVSDSSTFNSTSNSTQNSNKTNNQISNKNNIKTNNVNTPKSVDHADDVHMFDIEDQHHATDMEQKQHSNKLQSQMSDRVIDELNQLPPESPSADEEDDHYTAVASAQYNAQTGRFCSYSQPPERKHSRQASRTTATRVSTAQKKPSILSFQHTRSTQNSVSTGGTAATAGSTIGQHHSAPPLQHTVVPPPQTSTPYSTQHLALLTVPNSAVQNSLPSNANKTVAPSLRKPQTLPSFESMFVENISGGMALFCGTGVSVEDCSVVLQKLHNAKFTNSFELVQLLDECKSDCVCSCGAKHDSSMLPTCYEDEDGEIICEPEQRLHHAGDCSSGRAGLWLHILTNLDIPTAHALKLVFYLKPYLK